MVTLELPYPSLQSFARESKVVITRYSICDLAEEDYIKIDCCDDITRFEFGSLSGANSGVFTRAG